MRTTIRVVDGQPTQVIGEAGDYRLTTLDLSSHEDPLREANRVAQEQFDSPFDLATGPLFRFVLLTLGPDDHGLLAPFHHIISDRWSYSVLFREITLLYAARNTEKPSPLEDLNSEVTRERSLLRALHPGIEGAGNDAADQVTLNSEVVARRQKCGTRGHGGGFRDSQDSVFQEFLSECSAERRAT